MKILLSFVSMLCFVAFGYGQSDIEIQRELDILHKRFEAASDSISQLMVACNEQIAATTDSVSLIALKTKFEDLDAKRKSVTHKRLLRIRHSS